MNRTRVVIGIVVLLASLLHQPSPASQILMSDCNFGFHDGIYGTHEIVCVTGEADCTDDWPIPWPVVDIYIVIDNGRNWTIGADLNDAMGVPNTVDCTGLGGAFYDVQLALPSLPLGRYDVVIDENENGEFDTCETFLDYVLGQGSAFAFEVIEMNLEPVIGKETLKAHEAEEALRWERLTSDLELGIQLTELASLGLSASRFVAAGLSGPWILAATVGQEVIVRAALAGNKAVERWGKDLMRELGDRIIDRHQDIANDPPDARYAEIVELGEIGYGGASTGDSIATALAPVMNSLAEEAALLGAIRSVLEKFSGACAVPDNPVHPRAGACAEGVQRSSGRVAHTFQSRPSGTADRDGGDRLRRRDHTPGQPRGVPGARGRCGLP